MKKQFVLLLICCVSTFVFASEVAQSPDVFFDPVIFTNKTHDEVTVFGNFSDGTRESRLYCAVIKKGRNTFGVPRAMANSGVNIQPNTLQSLRAVVRKTCAWQADWVKQGSTITLTDNGPVRTTRDSEIGLINQTNLTIEALFAAEMSGINELGIVALEPKTETVIPWGQGWPEELCVKLSVLEKMAKLQPTGTTNAFAITDEDGTFAIREEPRITTGAQEALSAAVTAKLEQDQ